MPKTRISRTVTHRVVLDGSRYATALTVTQDGMVAPIADGADAIIGRQSADDVINRGRIAGAEAISANAAARVSISPPAERSSTADRLSEVWPTWR